MQQLLGDYYFKQMDAAEFEPQFLKIRSLVFENTFEFRVREALSTKELMRMEQLDRAFVKRERLRIGIFHKMKTFIGWHFGGQYPFGKFYMSNSGIVPEHQNKGVYSALLPHIIEMVRDKGYQSIFSRHAATNNAVLVPKLRAGFKITSVEIDDRWGVLIHLTYFFNPLRRKALSFRTGEVIPDAELRRYLSLGD